MKPKMFKKLTDHGYADWVAAISGEMGKVKALSEALLDFASAKDLKYGCSKTCKLLSKLCQTITQAIRSTQ